MYLVLSIALFGTAVLLCVLRSMWSRRVKSDRSLERVDTLGGVTLLLMTLSLILHGFQVGSMASIETYAESPVDISCVVRDIRGEPDVRQVWRRGINNDPLDMQLGYHEISELREIGDKKVLITTWYCPRASDKKSRYL